MYIAIKRWMKCLFIWSWIILAFSIDAFGATNRIGKVTLAFAYDQTPKPGDAIGTINIKSSSQEFTVTREEYTNDSQVWELGDRPEVTITLTAVQGFQFYYSSSSHFSLSGCGAEFSGAKVMDSGNTLVLKALLKPVKGKLEEPQNLDWDNTYAMWDQVEGARKYEVRLYRNKSQTASVITKNTAFDFRDQITRAGDYTFRVRGISRFDGKSGNWSDYSDTNTYTDEGSINNTNGSWIQNQTGWWYRYGNGDYPTNCWKSFDGKWYYFNGDGYMLNGWQYINGLWYFLNQDGVMLTGWQYINGLWYFLNQDGVMLTGWQNINSLWYFLNQDGVMLTGWQNINGLWYFLNQDGVMLTGWQSINDSWYYLDQNGAMFTSGTTPDGYYVGESGRWEG